MMRFIYYTAVVTVFCSGYAAGISDSLFVKGMLLFLGISVGTLGAIAVIFDVYRDFVKKIKHDE